MAAAESGILIERIIFSCADHYQKTKEKVSENHFHWLSETFFISYFSL
jgi:hypothetical protein